MGNLLRFKASTNVKSLIGKDLVTDEITAVFELVKNSYDADAREVTIEFYGLKEGNGKIIISDNGTGMDLYDIENKWMVIGTESKKGKEYSDIFRRPLNGDKGIGRFSVDRLGRKLSLSAVKTNSDINILMNFDWEIFEKNYSSIDEVNIPYRTELIDGQEEIQGVSLEISDLRDVWDKANISKLITSLRHFKSPFEIDDNFSIWVYAPDYFEEWIEIKSYKLEDISNLWVQVEIPRDNPTEINIVVNRDGIEYEETYPNIYEFGPIFSKVYFFDTPSKIRFKSRMGIRVKDFGNIRLYRDDFRIHPYGEEFNDWLELDRRKVQGTSRFFGTRDLIGFVQITKKHNKKIEVLTNRQGLIENSYYQQLKELLLDYAIKTLEKYFFKKSKNELFVESRKNVEEAVRELKRVAKEIQKKSPDTAKMLRQLSDVVQKSQAEQAAFVKNQEEVLNVYKRVANKEVLLHKIIHEALIRIQKVKTVSSSGKRKIRNYNNNEPFDDFLELITRDFGKIDKLTEDAKDYLKSARDHLMRERNREIINLKNFTLQVLSGFEEEFQQHSISANLEASSDLIYKIDREDFKTIINNFINNSIKSLKSSDGTDKEIKIRITENQRFIVFIFGDNGMGVPEHIRDRIFDPFFSTTGGFGMGLSIIDEIVKEYQGEFNLSRNYTSGAEFQIKLRK
ncbi:sensor histidine kinase [Brevibacillus dissolubilis]|uniref:sensor histidine kinase n=1 Tax=Brevibacillus dissolubilis TaxID=1844116 RepID=UPI00111668EB|nr:sensor histidine kinase [Brevibacillus dissolubilis]